MSQPDLGRDAIVWIKARVVDPPDHNGFMTVAVQTGYTPEPEKTLEVHATSIRNVQTNSTPAPTGDRWIWCLTCNQESRHIKRSVPGTSTGPIGESLWECLACNWRK